MNLMMRRKIPSMGPLVLMTAVSQPVQLVLKACDGGLEC